MLRMNDDLGLTDSQVEKLKKIKSDEKKRCIKDKAEIETLEVEFRDLMSEKKVNVRAVDGKIDKIFDIKAETRKNCVHAMLDAKKVLTDEQRKKLEDLCGPGKMKWMEKRIEVEIEE